MKRVLIGGLACLLLVPGPAAGDDLHVWVSNQTPVPIELLLDAKPGCSLGPYTGPNYTPGLQSSCTLAIADGQHVLTALHEDGSMHSALVDSGTPGHVSIRDGRFEGLRREPLTATTQRIDLLPACRETPGKLRAMLYACLGAIRFGATPAERATAHGALRYYYATRKDFAKALVHANGAVAQEPGDWNHLVARCGLRLDIDKEPDLGLADCNEAARLAPQELSPHWFRGKIRMRRGEWKAAIGHFDAALAIKPDWHHAHYLRGISKQQMGLAREGRAEVDAAIAAQPDLTEFFAIYPPPKP